MTPTSTASSPPSAAGNCDMIASSVSITDERKQANDFTQGYFEIHQSLLVRKGDETKYKDFASLKGKTIGVQSETTGADFATEERRRRPRRSRSSPAPTSCSPPCKAKQIDGVRPGLPDQRLQRRDDRATTVVSARRSRATSPSSTASSSRRRTPALLRRPSTTRSTQIRSDGELPTPILDRVPRRRGDEELNDGHSIGVLQPRRHPGHAPGAADGGRQEHARLHLLQLPGGRASGSVVALGRISRIAVAAVAGGGLHRLAPRACRRC